MASVILLLAHDAEAVAPVAERALVDVTVQEIRSRKGAAGPRYLVMAGSGRPAARLTEGGETEWMNGRLWTHGERLFGEVVRGCGLGHVGAPGRLLAAAHHLGSLHGASVPEISRAVRRLLERKGSGPVAHVSVIFCVAPGAFATPSEPLGPAAARAAESVERALRGAWLSDAEGEGLFGAAEVAMVPIDGRSGYVSHPSQSQAPVYELVLVLAHLADSPPLDLSAGVVGGTVELLQRLRREGRPDERRLLVVASSSRDGHGDALMRQMLLRIDPSNVGDGAEKLVGAAFHLPGMQSASIGEVATRARALLRERKAPPVSRVRVVCAVRPPMCGENVAQRLFLSDAEHLTLQVVRRAWSEEACAFARASLAFEALLVDARGPEEPVAEHRGALKDTVDRGTEPPDGDAMDGAELLDGEDVEDFSLLQQICANVPAMVIDRRRGMHM